MIFDLRERAKRRRLIEESLDAREVWIYPTVTKELTVEGTSAPRPIQVKRSVAAEFLETCEFRIATTEEVEAYQADVRIQKEAIDKAALTKNGQALVVMAPTKTVKRK